MKTTCIWDIVKSLGNSRKEKSLSFECKDKLVLTSPTNMAKKKNHFFFFPAHIALEAISFRTFGMFATTAFTHCQAKWSIGNNNHSQAVLYSKWIITLTE